MGLSLEQMFVVSGVVTVVLTLGMVVLVLAPRPLRKVNIFLAALLVADAANAISHVIHSQWHDDAVIALNADFYRVLTAFAFPLVYLLFVGRALPIPMTWPFRQHVAVPAVVLLMGALAFAGFQDPALLVGSPGVEAPLAPALAVLGAGVAAFGLVCSVNALLRTRAGTVARRRAKAYLSAFAIFDVGFIVGYLSLIRSSEHAVATDIVTNIASHVPVLVSYALLARALLRDQLFDFDLKVKIGLVRGVVAATFLVGFFIPTAIVGQYFQQYGAVAGGVAVGLLLLAIGPIRRAADSLADRIFPGVSDEVGYIMQKKIGVYQEALREGLLPGGGVDPARTNTLRRLRAKLQLSQRDHEMLLAALSMGTLDRGGLVVRPGATVLGKYRVERALGSGGGGHAFLALDMRMHRRVVLKTIRGADQAATLREARASAAIDHPNVVRVYDVDDLGAETLLVMEYVDAGSLQDRIAAGGALSDSAFARVSDDILSALGAVHAASAVHRDVKPGNVLLTRAGRAKLADFGIAKLPGFETTLGTPAAGTVQYMSPEQARGKRLTAASDLYSAAATIYEARTGHAFVEALPGESVVEMQMRIGAGHPFDKKVKPAALRDWFARALAPEHRFSNATEMRKALAAALPAGRA